MKIETSRLGLLKSCAGLERRQSYDFAASIASLASY